MVPSSELSIVVWSRYVALKLLWRIWESDVKQGYPFHTLLQIFYKKYSGVQYFQDLQFPFWNIKTHFRKSMSVLRLGLKSSISWNMRHFFRVFFWNYFSSSGISVLKHKLLKLGARKFNFSKYYKDFFFRKYKKVFNLGARKFRFPKHDFCFGKM